MNFERMLNTRLYGPGVAGVLLLCLFLAPCSIYGQNLVPNHSFEQVDSCLEINTWYYPNTGPLDWFSASGTGDLFLSCLPDSSFNSVPQSLWAHQAPQDGDNYVGLITYDWAMGVREYFAVELFTPLVVGETYYASFYASPTWGGTNLLPQMWVGSSHVGMRFSMLATQWEFPDPNPPPIDQAHIFHPSIISDTANWTLVSGSFVADSAYLYLIIGNHFGNPLTDTLQFGEYSWNPLGHTLIDNVCVSSEATGCPLSVGFGELATKQVRLFPNPARDQVNITDIPSGSDVQIFDAMGRSVWKSLEGVGHIQLNVATWSRGPYVLLITKNLQRNSFKFVLTN